MHQCSYLLCSLFWLAVWAAIFAAATQHRRAMIWTGLLLAPAGPVSEYWSLKDYWHPPYVLSISVGAWRFGVEDYILTFALAGSCAGVFGIVAARRGWPAFRGMSLPILLRVAGWSALGLLLMFLLASVLRVGSIRALLLATVGTSLIMLAGRWPLLILAALLAVPAALGYWLFYVAVVIPLFPNAFRAFWSLDATWGITWLGVPIEEFLWAGAAMLFAGPLLLACSGTPREPKTL